MSDLLAAPSLTVIDQNLKTHQEEYRVFWQLQHI